MKAYLPERFLRTATKPAQSLESKLIIGSAESALEGLHAQ
jgi:hypothetical protein